MSEKNLIINGLYTHFFQSENLTKEGTLVFLHGWGSEAAHLKGMWGKCDNYLALDLPGLGKSELPKSLWGVGEYAEFLKAFLEKMEIRNPILIGHSFGGSTIIRYLSHGGQAKKVILISPSGIREKSLKIYVWYVLSKTFKVMLMIPGLNLFRNRLRKKFYKAIDSEDYIEAGSLTESYKKIIREDLREDMKKINIPTVLIWGENDKATPLKYGRITQQIIQGSRLDVIKNAGHFSFIDQPNEFQEIFLKEIDVA